MKRAIIASILLLASCNSRPKEQQLIVDYMKENANDPSSYDPVSFRFLGPATYDNTGLIKGDSTRYGDLYEHTFRAKNGFGATMLGTKVFYVGVGDATPLPDSLGEKAISGFRP